MKLHKKLTIKSFDIIIICAVLLTALIFGFINRTQTAGTYAVITQNGEVVEQIEFGKVTKSYTLTLTNGVEVSVEKDGVAIIASSCRSKACIHTGKCCNNGDIAVCVPNKTAVVITGEKQSGTPDIITY